MPAIPLYELAILGSPPLDVLDGLREILGGELKALGLGAPGDVFVFAGSPNDFVPSNIRSTAALCFTCAEAEHTALERMLAVGLPIVPVASTEKGFTKEVPSPLLALNGLALDKHSRRQLCQALLECAGLLPRQRRVFVSYRRGKGTNAAVQVYGELSARGFEVFLDTYKIHPGEHFQDVLWQRLCDCDVLVMLDTDDYFESRWTNAEFGRAMARGLAFVRMGWPGVPLNPRAGAAMNIPLDHNELAVDGSFTGSAIARVCRSVEEARSTSVASRYRELVDTFAAKVKKVGGQVHGVTMRRTIIVRLADGRTVAAYPALGVPSSETLHDATLDNHPAPVAVVYDDVGMCGTRWQRHMDWLDPHLRRHVRLVPSYRSGWDFADWH